MMIIKISSILMVLIGAIFLFFSLLQAINILKIVAGQFRRKWLVILYLMGFFILGYLFFDIILISNLSFPIELVTGGVFLGGAFFVYIVIHISQSTISAQQKAEEAIALARDDWESTFDSVTDMITVHDMDFNIVRSNPAAKSVLGLQLQEGVPFVKCFRCYHGTEEPPSICTSCQSLRTGKPTMAEMFEPHLNRHIEVRAIPRFGNDLQLVGLIHIVRDITERKRAEEALRNSEANYKQLFDNAPSAIYQIDFRTGKFLKANDVICEYFGCSQEEVTSISPCDLLTKESQILFLERLNKMAIGDKVPEDPEFEFVDKNGKRRWLKLNCKNIYDSKGLAGADVVAHEITESKNAEDELRKSEYIYQKLSIIDDLTQLYNSRHFYAQLEREIERSNRYEQPLTLLMLDLDNFKTFNDTYGHVEGDHVLSRLGLVVKRCLRETDSAYRYGGEEFTILLPMTTSEEGIVTAKRIQTELSKEAFFPVLGQEVYITVSIGLAQFKPKEEIKAFVNRVDQFMYQAKKNGRDRIYFESQLQEQFNW